jgi:arylformamidase
MGGRYRHLSDAEINAQFMPRIAVADHETWLRRGAENSGRARQALSGRLDIRYGPGRRQTLDCFPAATPDAPLHAFIHGGYWRALDKSDFSYVAASLVPAGATVLVLNYDLCPTVTLDAIVGQMRDALIWIHAHARELGGDPERIFLSGNSAGAHLAAMMLAQDWTAAGLPRNLVKGACCITGIYELTPVLGIEANADIRLPPERVAQNSPLVLPVRNPAPAIVAVGENEPPEWIRQSADYHAMRVREGLPSEFHLVPGTHHFSITDTLSDPGSLLSQAIIRQMGL